MKEGKKIALEVAQLVEPCHYCVKKLMLVQRKVFLLVLKLMKNQSMESPHDNQIKTHLSIVLFEVS